MSELDNKPYEVSFIASALEELKVGDRVEVVDADSHRYKYIGRKGFIVENPNPSNGYVRVSLVPDGNAIESSIDFEPSWLRKLLDTDFSIDAKYFEDSDNVKAFKAILNEMAETYKAKDATYGNAYQDGFNRFGAVQLVSRMYEKYCRIENLLVRTADNKVPDESVLDTLTDLSVQCICLRMLLQKNDFENVV